MGIEVWWTFQGELRMRNAHVIQTRPARTGFGGQAVRVDGEEVGVESPVKCSGHRKAVRASEVPPAASPQRCAASTICGTAIPVRAQRGPYLWNASSLNA
jgi:hypothetical protein